MKTIQPTCDKTYRQSFVRLILKSLKKCKNSEAKQLTFNPQEKQVIEHHLKDIAREPVFVDTSLEECVQIFITRIERLIKSDANEWEIVREIIKNNARYLTPEEIIEFDNIFHYFYRINHAQTQYS